MTTRRYGILKGQINEPYANVGVAISGDKCSLVGVSYAGGIVLFRVFDGSYITYFPHGTTIEILAVHPIITELMLFELDEEAWVVDGHEGNLAKRMTMSVGISAGEHTDVKDTTKVLLSYANLSGEPIVNGYSRINEIILGTYGSWFEDFTTVKSPLNTSIVNSKYFKSGVSITREKKGYLDPSFIKVQEEAHQHFRALSSSFIQLMTDNELYQKYVMNLTQSPHNVHNVPNVDVYVEYIRNGAVSETDKIKLVSVLSQMIYGILPSSVPNDVDKLVPSDLTDDIKEIGNGLETLLCGFEDSKVPTLHIPSMIESYNRLAQRVGLNRLSLPETTYTKGQSIGALIVTGNNGFLPSEIEVNLSSGDVVILPTKGGSLSDFNYSELIEILRYLMSIRDSDSRFNALTTKVTQELAIKTRTKNTMY